MPSPYGEYINFVTQVVRVNAASGDHMLRGARIPEVTSRVIDLSLGKGHDWPLREPAEAFREIQAAIDQRQPK